MVNRFGRMQTEDFDPDGRQEEKVTKGAARWGRDSILYLSLATKDRWTRLKQNFSQGD
jgi:hypothetical protein